MVHQVAGQALRTELQGQAQRAQQSHVQTLEVHSQALARQGPGVVALRTSAPWRGRSAALKAAAARPGQSPGHWARVAPAAGCQCPGPRAARVLGHHTVPPRRSASWDSAGGRRRRDSTPRHPPKGETRWALPTARGPEAVWPSRPAPLTLGFRRASPPQRGVLTNTRTSETGLFTPDTTG